MAGHVVILAPGDRLHCPTSDTRRQVAQMIACGLDHIQIAFVLNCQPHEVKYWYIEELEHGAAITTAQVGAALLKNALNGDVNAQKFWLATRGGWAPPTPEQQSKNQTTAMITEEKRKIMDRIVTLVATDKVREERGETVVKATKGATRVQ